MLARVNVCVSCICVRDCGLVCVCVCVCVCVVLQRLPSRGGAREKEGYGSD